MLGARLCVRAWGAGQLKLTDWLTDWLPAREIFYLEHDPVLERAFWYKYCPYLTNCIQSEKSLWQARTSAETKVILAVGSQAKLRKSMALVYFSGSG